MDSVDITDSAFSLASSTSNDIIVSTNEIISNQINLIPDISDVIPDVISSIDSVKNTINDIIPVIPESIHVDDNNSIFIYMCIGALIILFGVFIYNYYNKNKQVRFNETPEVNYIDSSSTYSTRSEF